ncbi:hypothetical protein EC912_102265 [Luteibacter rhizovicinus]|uniref:DUF4168 domain-containing protein n=1 Tax=Luteibacter rhizovicinus TaxID=242606 RepID=A0A4R3YTT0_9GAMM|nr:hypothetical protein [Luteibacter rhizovicinus]TCV95920.1 hypothetical protein EC912_102265 [Luteibacter rhizovicinus]
MKLSFPAVARVAAAFGLLLAALVPMAALAQDYPASHIPESDKQAIQNYQLNDDVFKRIVAVSQEAKAAGIKPSEAPTDFNKIHSLEDLANQVVSADPRIAPLIKKYGFTPRDFLLANLAVTNAAIASEAKSNPEMAKYVDQKKVNQANVAFYESHKAQISALMKESDDGK